MHVLALTYQPCLIMRYLPSSDRSTTVEPRRLWPPIGPPSTTTASLGQSSWNSFRWKIKKWADAILPIWKWAILINILFHRHIFRTHMYSHRACLWADVCTGKCKWLPAHLAQTSHEIVVWDTYTYKLEWKWTCYKVWFDNLSTIQFREHILK